MAFGSTICYVLIFPLGQIVTLPTFNDPHLAAVLLKKYFRDLPDPIFPETLYPIIRQCPLPSGDPTDMTAILYIRDTLLPQLKPCVYILLSNVLSELRLPLVWHD